MSAPILSTKLSIPAPRPDLIDRPQLFERLDAGLRLGHQLTLISAMAGSGKTMLMAAWLRRIDRPAGWLAVDSDDNDVARFISQLIAALRRIDSSIGQAAQNLLEAQHPPSLESLTGLLINDIAATSTAFVLVLDNFQAIRTAAIHSTIAFLLDHQPPQLHLVLLTREDPPLPLPRLRARGQMTEVRTADLRFTTAEIARFLRQTYGLALDAPLVAALDARTEGWIAGVQLAALALQEHDDLAKCIDDFSGSHRYVIDYLAEDVLRQLPDDLRAFLGQTAILGRLTAPLCDAVTGRTDSAACLQRLMQANMFIIPLDEHREWYRYHPLFAEFLCSALRTDEHPTLHRRAAHWYRAQGFLEEAVEHALASNDRQLATDLIGQAARRGFQQDRPPTLLGWVGAVPETQMRTAQPLQPAAAPAETFSLLEALSRREGEILRLIETGMPNEAVAHALVIAPGTVKKHLDNIYGKLGVHNRTEAVARARQLDLL
jgi:LuxR family maltose regulon positive regulatory protein